MHKQYYHGLQLIQAVTAAVAAEAEVPSLLVQMEVLNM